MRTERPWRLRAAALTAASVALTTLTAGGAVAAAGPGPDRGHGQGHSHAPIVWTHSGKVRGERAATGFAFRGLPYAAPPTGELRWRAPRPPASWRGVRDATSFAPSCLQQPNPSEPPDPQSEDCLYLNVSTPTLHPHARRPVIVWIHGGGNTQDGARNYIGTDLAAKGVVVVTIDYRLGAFGYLAHPALARRPGGPAGNYGLMDQQAALRWVRHNIAAFGGNPHDVTIAGQSSGGLSVLEQMVSHGARGLFQRAVVESGAFALQQQPLADAEAFGTTYAAGVGCPGQSARTAFCLRHKPAQALVDAFPATAIPGVVDGRVLRESVGTALAAGRFARVPVINGISHDEELIFVAGQGLAVSGGMFVEAPTPTADTYESVIASVLGVSPDRAAEIAAEYPLAAYPADVLAFSTLLSDANFACPALQVDEWTSRFVPTFAYQFNDDTAPPIYAGPTFPPIATHSSETQYLFDLPNAPYPATLNATQEALASKMRAAWASFAAHGNPSTRTVPWPAFHTSADVLSLVSPQPQLYPAYATIHHCSFWAAG